MEIIIHNTLAWIESSKYFLLYLGTLVEGPVVMIISGFLYGLGQFKLLPMYIILILGNFTADIGWYTLGRYGTRNFVFKYGRFIGFTPDILKKVEHYFKLYNQKILIITKLTTGFGFAAVVLIAAGMFKVPFKNYLILTLIGGFIWTALLITIGYFFGNIFEMVPTSMKILLGILIISIFVLSIKYIQKYFKNKKI